MLALGIRETGAHGTRYVVTRLTGITLPPLTVLLHDGHRDLDADDAPVGPPWPWFQRNGRVQEGALTKEDSVE